MAKKDIKTVDKTTDSNKIGELDWNIIQSETDVETKVILPMLRQAGIITSERDYNQRVPVRMKEGRKVATKEADIVVYKHGKPFLVVEAKNTSEYINDDVIAQMDSYSFWLSAPYSIACNGKEFVLRAYLAGNQKIQIIRKEVEKLSVELLSDAVKDALPNKVSIPQRIIADQSESFSSLLKSIHQDIRDIDHLDPTNAFDGWSKLLFMKINEEKWSRAHQGQIRFSYKKFLEEKALERAASYIKDTFRNTCESYPNIFSNSQEEIGLSLDAIEKILKRLDGYKILEIPMDVKGKAYEIFLSSTFRGKGLGQFFTPRQVVDFMVELVDFKISTVLLDPACGTGGFLIKGYQKILEKIHNTPEHVFKEWHTTRDKFIDNVKDAQIYGIDAEPRATKTAKMNMIMWGDGENIVRGNGLSDMDINKNPYAFNKGEVNIILANPPFGNKEKDESVLKKYELYTQHNNVKTECLFIERAIETLAPKGELAIVLPDGILGGSSLNYLRQFIRRYCRIMAVVSLPKHTFTPSGVQTINSSVLFLQKFQQEYLEELLTVSNNEEVFNLQKKYGILDYSVFMAVANEIGYEPNGKATRSGKNDLDSILADFKMAETNNFFKEDAIHGISANSLTIHISKIEGRIDSRYYWFKNHLDNMKFERVPLGKYIEFSKEKVDPHESPDETFSILSVTNRYGIILDESDAKKYEVRGEDFTQSYKVVHAGDIVFNPYRVNVGSIGIVDEEYDGYIVSPAYVVFRSTNGLDSKTLIALLKNKFYSLYIDILATGSIRNNFGKEYLKKILIPKSLIDGDTTNVLSKYDEIAELENKIQQKKKEMQDQISQCLF